MAAARVHKFTTISELEFFLRGGLLGGKSIVPRAGDGSRSSGGGIFGLVGTTLTIDTPAASITFVAAVLDPGETRDPAALMFKDIKTQIETAQAALKVVNLDGRIGLIEASPTSGIALAAADEEARLLLGLPNNQAVTTKVYNRPGGVAPSAEIYNGSQSTHVIITWE